MEKLFGMAVYFQSSLGSQRLDKDKRESTYLLSIQSGALPFWHQKTGENVLWLETNEEDENGKNRAAPHLRLLTSHWNAVSCLSSPLPWGPHLGFVNAALHYQVRNLHTVLSWRPQGTEGMSSVPSLGAGWAAREGCSMART